MWPANPVRKSTRQRILSCCGEQYFGKMTKKQDVRHYNLLRSLNEDSARKETSAKSVEIPSEPVGNDSCAASAPPEVHQHLTTVQARFSVWVWGITSTFTNLEHLLFVKANEYYWKEFAAVETYISSRHLTWEYWRGVVQSRFSAVGLSR